MEVTEYRRRASIQEQGETLWRAFPDRLEFYSEDGALRGVVPYSKVQQVRLAFAPGRFQRTRFLMELTGAQSRLTLTNVHFKGVGRFEDRTASFFPLVRAVVTGIHGANRLASNSLLEGLVFGRRLADLVAADVFTHTVGTRLGVFIVVANPIQVAD